MTVRLQSLRPTQASDRETSVDLLDASDVWLAPPNGRVVFDGRGSSVWQWPSNADPFGRQDALRHMNAEDLRIVEPGEIHRCERPWLHESERPAKEIHPGQQPPAFAPTLSARARRMR